MTEEDKTDIENVCNETPCLAKVFVTTKGWCDVCGKPTRVFKVKEGET